MIRITISIILFICVSVGNAQFPKLCEGTWEGTMELWSGGKVNSTIGIKLYVAPVKGEQVKWIWNTSYYVDGKEDTTFAKNYYMVERDAATGRYVMDEGNGIMLDCHTYGNKLYSIFTVKKEILTAVYELKGDELIFEVTAGTRLKGKQMGVTSYTTDYVQRAVFKKV
jgi:hypothetical protein